jgi:myosin heavy subunit
MSDSERPPQPLDLTSSTSQKEAEAKGSAEKSAEVVESVPDKREEALQTAISSMHTAVGAKQAELTAAGRSLDVNIQQYLQQYFQNAIHRFDADKDGKISEQESQKFRDSMVTKTNEIVGGMIKAGKAAKKMEKAAEKAEKMDSQKVQASLESVQALSDLTDLEQANDELQKIQSQNEAFQQTVQTQLDSVQQFSKSFNEFQEAQEGFGHFAQLWDAVVNSTEHSMAIAGMKANLENTRVAVSNALNNLKEKQKILDANGEKIKAAFTKARQDIIRAREEKKAEVEKAKQEQADQIEARKQEYTRLEKEKKTLEDRRNQIAERQKKAEKIRTDWDKQGEEEKNANREANYKDEQEDIQAELHGFELILQNPNITQSVKDSIRDDYEKAKERQKTNELALNIIESKKKSGLEFEKNLNENERAVAQELRSADAHLARQRATELSMQQNIDRLKQIQLQYATSS